MKNLYKVTNIILIAFFAVLILLRIFYRLDAIGWLDIDEAKHASNAYETFKAGNWVVHLYNGEVDYVNSKPPLYYWLTNILFGLFGINILTFKLPSAIAGTILCVIISVFLYRHITKRFGKKDLALSGVVVFLAVFLSMDLLYDYHMIRTGNFDALYVLFILAGIICMIKAQDDNRYLIPFGAFTGLAFLAKGFNSTTVVLSAICCIPLLAKEKRLKYIIYSVLTAIVVVFPWAALRFRFDGTEFFYNMLFGEAKDKLVGVTFEFFQMMPKTLTFRLLMYGMAFYIIALFIGKKSGKMVAEAVLSDLRENAILWIWFWVSILFYSWAGFFNEWYIYSSFVLAAVLSGIYVAIGIDSLKDTTVALKVIATLSIGVILAVAAYDGIHNLGSYWLAGNGGGPALPFWADMREIKEMYGDQYQGSDVYVEDISQYADLDDISIEDAPTSQELFFDKLAYAEYECDWHEKKGGIDAWKEAEDGILVVNKDILDRFIDRLSGHVIIQDDGYIYFIHDTY
ncbi:hypothetical protein D6855_12740 [Butyrivibrio sp. CB08]|uniref:ArnT family glycosyltransferase n=1 Tax=Butyrivibrio sp. CB08 TaxID=2364879 RepID=UPI000EA87194|nr:glycosyltransferase family 39 protein [Butyrivibrio sp. CB08]RKM57910.1 hypothetical protein D6855_12740 [Butyrivibrio sp. CB08]